MTLDEAQAQATSTAVTASLEGKGQLARIWRIDRFIFDERGRFVMECQSLRHAELQCVVFGQALRAVDTESEKAKIDAQVRMKMSDLELMKVLTQEKMLAASGSGFRKKISGGF